METALTIKQGITPEQIDLIKKTVAVGATDDELKLFLHQANKRGLDPLTRQIHFIKRARYNKETKSYEEVGTIQTGIDGFRLIADRTGKLSGIKRGVILSDKGELLRAWAEIYRKDWTEPAREEVSFKEYCQHNKDGEPQGLWKTMPETMLKKVAEAAALRMAFPEDLSGLYSDDEMSQADIKSEHPQPIQKHTESATEASKPLTPGSDAWILSEMARLNLSEAGVLEYLNTSLHLPVEKTVKETLDKSSEKITSEQRMLIIKAFKSKCP